ncbi:hypothetical protein [Lacipirellula sp.]|uniref:hypothetical protein n=1 Tax=Lacipirellula sp. TaxID=2691419 RepID=UPI003D10FC83
MPQPLAPEVAAAVARAVQDLRFLARTLAAAGQHAAALRLLGMEASVRADVLEKLEAAPTIAMRVERIQHRQAC